VLVGSILGLVLSYFSYRQYFPELTSRLSHRPYEPRHTLENPWDEVVREDQEGAGRHLRHESESSTSDHPLQGPANGPHRQGSQYRDESIERADGELEGVAPRTGAQDLTETWREGQGKITDVEAGR
jgi:diacylglycerol diphosphate phosphatase/phosphatidate phosphatase